MGKRHRHNERKRYCERKWPLPPLPRSFTPHPPDLPEDAPVRPPDSPSAFTFSDGWYAGPPLWSFETKPPRKVTAFKDAPVETDVFLSIFPEFGANKELYSRALIEACAKRAWFYCCRFSQCDQLDGDDRLYARYLMTAHLIVLLTRQRAVTENKNNTVTGLPTGVQMVGMKTSATGQMGTTGMVTSASIGGESVSLTLPQSQNAWEFWLNQTMYGVEYQAFMSSHVPVGIYSEGDDLRLCLRD